MGFMTTNKNEYRIKLQISGRDAYYSPGQWDGCWFTRDPGEAKTYKLERNARKLVAEYPTDSVWATAVVEPVQ